MKSGRSIGKRTKAGVKLTLFSLFAGMAIAAVGAGSAAAQEQSVTAKPSPEAIRASQPAKAPPRQKIATQKRMRNPWEKSIEVASTRPRAKD